MVGVVAGGSKGTLANGGRCVKRAEAGLQIVRHPCHGGRGHGRLRDHCDARSTRRVMFGPGSLPPVMMLGSETRNTMSRGMGTWRTSARPTRTTSKILLRVPRHLCQGVGRPELVLLGRPGINGGRLRRARIAFGPPPSRSCSCGTGGWRTGDPGPRLA